MVTLYSNNCLNCQLLKTELKKAHIEYQECNDIDKMIEMGLNEMPMLCVNDRMLNVGEAITWIKKGAIA